MCVSDAVAQHSARAGRQQHTCAASRVPIISEIISATPTPSPTEASPFLPTASALVVRNFSIPWPPRGVVMVSTSHARSRHGGGHLTSRNTSCSSELHGVIFFRSVVSLRSFPFDPPSEQLLGDARVALRGEFDPRAELDSGLS
eukprot:1919030-Rhodomonas_salina.3